MVVNSNIGEYPTLPFGTSFIKKTNNIHKLKSRNNSPSKYKESTRLSQIISFILVSIEINYTITSDSKPTKSGFDMLENQKNTLLKKEGGNYNEESKRR